MNDLHIHLVSAFGITGAADDFVEDGAAFVLAFPDTVVQFESFEGICLNEKSNERKNFNL